MFTELITGEDEARRLRTNPLQKKRELCNCPEQKSVAEDQHRSPV